jgi:hypothetical protein
MQGICPVQINKEGKREGRNGGEMRDRGRISFQLAYSLNQRTPFLLRY